MDPSLLADSMEWESGRYNTWLMNDSCPLNSFSVLPDFNPCILKTGVGRVTYNNYAWLPIAVSAISIQIKTSDSEYLK